MPSAAAAGAQQGPPYAPTTASLGGSPTIHEDIPITAVFLFLFLCGAVGHMTVFQINKRRGHKFLISGMLFGFCMARITTMVMRIVWANYPHDVSVAIAAQIFVAAGVVLLFVANLLFAQRLVRAAHPNFGWHRSFSIAFKVLYALIIIFLIMVITATVDTFYTLNTHTRKIDRRIQLSAQTYYALVSFIPIPLVILGLLVPRKTRVEKFGSGRWRTKVIILLTSSFLLCLGAAFRVGTNFKTPRPRNNPAWYHSKACFYIFNFTVEIIVVFLYLFLRVDRRFYIPNGSKGPGDYSRKEVHGTRTADEEAIDSERIAADNTAVTRDHESHGHAIYRINTEEEVFDDKEPAGDDDEEASKVKTADRPGDHNV
ncbi:hypothetical protein UCRPC4_g02100 [Phaeomoniella chlamydospora]|uniref:Family c-likeg-protein-coupled receptor protein n=1 Tax=Phaeomoniella chlamydospora TaxID=158046 RepID=A0A0G2GNQ9_PHACM|nr:hypothetical protein UCRPC4_g02100 [Phaeomoniella chlamydospora]